MSKEGEKLKTTIGCVMGFIGMLFLFPAWVYVIRAILIRGEATDVEWIVFYAYVAGHVAWFGLMRLATFFVTAMDD